MRNYLNKISSKKVKSIGGNYPTSREIAQTLSEVENQQKANKNFHG